MADAIDLIQAGGFAPPDLSAPVDLIQSGGLTAPQPQQSFLRNAFNALVPQGLASLAGNIGQDIGGLAKTGLPGALSQAFTNVSRNVPQAQMDPLMRAAQVAQAIPQAAASGGTQLMDAANRRFPIATTGAQGYLDAMLKAAPGAIALNAAIPGAGAVGQGAVYGATQSAPGNAIAGTGLGALFGAAGQAIPGVLGGVKNMVMDKFQNAVAPTLRDTLEKGIGQAQSVDNRTLLDLVKNNHESLSELEEPAWNNLKAIAQHLDNTGVPFDSTPYQNALLSHGLDLVNQTKGQTYQAKQIEPVLERLMELGSDAPNSWEGAILHAKNINQQMRDEYFPGTTNPLPDAMRPALNNAKNSLAANIESQIKQNPTASPLGNAWQNAKSISSELANTFEQTVSPKTLRTQISPFQQILNMQKMNKSYDSSDFVNPYLPQNKNSGTASMQQFTKMVGDPAIAKQGLVSNIFDKAMDDGKLNINKAINIYNGLGQDQKNYLFNPDEQNLFEAVKATKGVKAANQQSVLGALLHGGGGLLTGMLAAPHLGGSATEGAIAGAAIPQIAQRLMEKAASANPMTNYLQARLLGQAPQLMPRTSAALQSMAVPLMAAARYGLLPAMTQGAAPAGTQMANQIGNIYGS